MCMKTKLGILSLFVMSMVLMSCDATKSKVTDVAKKFVQAANSNDKATIYELYPSMRRYSKLLIADNLTDKNISVELNETDSTSTYIVHLDDKMKLLMNVSDGNTITIVDSYNVFQLDSLYHELAVKIGMPTTQLSDVTKARFLYDDYVKRNKGKETLLYYNIIENLKQCYSDAMNGYLYAHDAQIAWGGGYNKYVRFEIPVSNGGSTMVKGEDYSVEITHYATDTEKRIGTSVEKGVDLAPGETYVFITHDNGLYRYANNKNITYDIDFHFKLSEVEMLLKYGRFFGTEYQNWENL